MCDSVRLFFYSLFRHHCGHIVFIASLIGVSSASAKPAIFSMSDEEKEQWKQQKIIENLSMQVMSLGEIDDPSTYPLTEDTYKTYQGIWQNIWYDTFYTGEDSYQYWIADAIWNLSGEENEIQTMRSRLDHITLTLLPLLYHTNTAFKATTERQLDEVIGKLDKLAGDDGAGNANINVNFQPIQQVLTDINDNVDISRQRLSEIEQHAYHISENTDVLKMINDEIAYQTRTLNQNLADGFDEANQTLNHIDSDLHGIIDNGVKADVDFGDMNGILDEALARNNEQLVNEIERIAEETTKPEKLGDEYMNEAYNQEQSADYVINTLIGAKDQLQNELAQIQYTNINARVYDYDEYNNYYTLESSFNNPTSNDQYIREKVQEYIDQVTYTTENVKGQITSRLDELKSSTLLTTDYDPEWLVVKKGALSQKWDFPKNDWVVDFSEIKLESNITKTVYDWIYYVLAIVVIYKQFSKVV